MKRQLLRGFLWLMVVTVLVTGAFATDFQAANPDQFYDALEQAFVTQLTDFNIQYQGEISELTEETPILAIFQRELATWDFPGVDNPLNVAYNIDGGDCTLEGDTLVFTGMGYFCTPEQLAFVEQEAANIAATLDLDGASDLLKIRTVYSYVTTNFTYDWDLTRFSAYDGLMEGTMVCQGYALLLNQLMWAVDIPSTVITGVSRSQNHAWNAVEYQGEWYLLDPTWDSADNAGTEGTWNYFMESEDDFSGHTAHDSYKTHRFMFRHPLAEASFPLEMISLMEGESMIGSLIIRTGISTSFEIAMPEGLEELPVVWSTGNGELLSVTEDGTITGISPGATWLQVTAPEEETVFPRRLTVNVVDMSTLSPWSEDEIVDFYLGTMLPATLCRDYQSTLTRAELARLTSHFVENTCGFGSFRVTNLFDDMEGHSDVFNVLRCTVADLMNGVSKTEFAPDVAVTRQEVATVAVRLLEYVNGVEYEADLSLVEGETDLESWAEEAMSKAVALGLFQGDEDGLRPLDTMTREEIYLTYSRIFSLYIPQV
ncbi:MAG: S-layer homology domain-containing protein, partial [Eubacteriales bacterium]